VTRFIELAGEINSRMPAHVIQKVMEALNARGKAVKGARMLVLGAAYKRGTDDPRESPGLEILELLLTREARAEYSDPHIPRLPIGRRHKLDLTSVPLTETSLRVFDAAVLVTDHSAFAYELIHRAVPLIVDTRNSFRSRRARTSFRHNRAPAQVLLTATSLG